MDALPAVAEMVEAGASVGGGDRASVIAATVAALEIAGEAEGLPFDVAREVRLRFDEGGDVTVTLVDDAGTESAATVAANDLAAFFAAANDDTEGERPSLPPAA